MTDRKVVVEEEIFDRQEAARYLKLGADKFDKLYRVCADYQGGKEKALGAIVGQVMRQTKGQANAQIVNDLVLRKLTE